MFWPYGAEYLWARSAQIKNDRGLNRARPCAGKRCCYSDETGIIWRVSTTIPERNLFWQNFWWVPDNSLRPGKQSQHDCSTYRLQDSHNNTGSGSERSGALSQPDTTGFDYPGRKVFAALFLQRFLNILQHMVRKTNMFSACLWGAHFHYLLFL